MPAFMCGRYVSPDEAAIERTWHIGRGNMPFVRRYNIAPTEMVPVLTRDRDTSEFQLA
jgi:putative SOS response-associated peptidase YedK